MLSARFGYIRASKLANERNDEVIAQRSRQLYPGVDMITTLQYTGPDFYRDAMLFFNAMKEEPSKRLSGFKPLPS